MNPSNDEEFLQTLDEAPNYCMQMVMQPEFIQDPNTGEFVMTTTFVKPNCGGGRFHGELIDIRVKQKKGDLYRVVVKPHNQKVISGIGSVRVLDGQKELANSSTIGSQRAIELDFKSSNGMKVIVEIDWKYNVKDVWPPIIQEEITVNNQKEVHAEVRVK